jgi:hypothetical protein
MPRSGGAIPGLLHPAISLQGCEIPLFILSNCCYGALAMRTTLAKKVQ